MLERENTRKLESSVKEEKHIESNKKNYSKSEEKYVFIKKIKMDDKSRHKFKKADTI